MRRKDEFDFLEGNEFEVADDFEEEIDDYDLIDRYYRRKKILMISGFTVLVLVLACFITLTATALAVKPSQNDLVLQNDFSNLNYEDYFS